ncbi:hypothetical protein K4K49_004934 [Colletotrichum sp. SAR 10_70]|nr:hypothetical protein K4K50_004331 [Colletotrichum sp. SAR 10_71]KAI8168940.1 hypothetical protein K4K49_004934 [Colletotrichum sp. SAR 10_70]
MLQPLKNVVVLGGSLLWASLPLLCQHPTAWQILLVEPHSHFHHLFAFPRFAVLPDHEHKAFIPYTAAFSKSSDPSRHQVIQARAKSLRPNSVILDREWQGSGEIPFEYLVVTTGTRLPSPGTMPGDDKPSSVDTLRAHQQAVQKASSVILIGGGAVGVQMATDLKEIYPEKEVTLVHSREHLMPLYHTKLDEIIKARFEELGIKYAHNLSSPSRSQQSLTFYLRLITGSRAVIPPGGLASQTSVKLQDGRELSADLIIPATGQTPNNQFLQDLKQTGDAPLVNPANGFIKVRPTLQFQDPAYSHIFAAGDIADSGAHKAARPGAGQAKVVAQNILAMINGQEPTEHIVVTPPAIHLSLGLVRPHPRVTKKNFVFRNPDVAAGQTEPAVVPREEGTADMNIEGVWERRGVRVTDPREYHL